MQFTQYEPRQQLGNCIFKTTHELQALAAYEKSEWNVLHFAFTFSSFMCCESEIISSFSSELLSWRTEAQLKSNPLEHEKKLSDNVNY